MPHSCRGPLIPSLLAAAALLATGCRDPSRGAEGSDGPAVPPPEAARAGLVQALDDWRAERPSPTGVMPKVGLVDSERIAQRRLLDYEVLGPVDLGVGRGFHVRDRKSGVE